jgi:thiosulfate dehydrogenase [quinone] large subunit
MAASTTLPAVPDRADLSYVSTDPRVLGGESESSSLTAARVGRVALNLLRLALGVEFLWAFLDKTFGLGYATPDARAWVHGGSPTKGFLSGVDAGPLQSLFNAIAGNPVIDWLFMLGLLGIGVALILGVALRIAAASGVVLLLMMWLASWPLASTVAGKPTGSTNPLIDDHIISALAIIVVGAYAAHSAGYLGRWWSHQPLVRRLPWLR